MTTVTKNWLYHFTPMSCREEKGVGSWPGQIPSDGLAECDWETAFFFLSYQ